MQRQGDEIHLDTTEARAGGAADVDAASAAIILDQFLRELP